MPRNNYTNIDESKIIKKDSTPTTPVDNTATQQVIQPTVQPTVEIPKPIEVPVETIVEKPKDEVKPITKPVIEEPPKNVNNADKSKSYFNIIDEYEKQVKEENKTKEEEVTESKTKIPVYNYSRDLNTGKVKVEPKKQKEVEPEAVEEIELTGDKKITKQLLDTTNENILRTEIEIQVYTEIMKSENDPDQRRLYETKLKSFGNDLNFYKKRKTILETILKG